MRTIVFGIRKSALAKSQFDEFMAHLAKHKITMDYSIKTIVTQGDKNQTAPLHEIGQGIFVKEIERTLLKGRIDCAIHSLKDLPVRITKGTGLSCFPVRQDPRDCLLVRENISAPNLRGLSVGTGSPRRSAFLKEMEPEAQVLPLRGNIDTRVRKLDHGDYDAIVLAACGIKRIGLENRISRFFDPETFVPAGGQGIICSQTREDDAELNEMFKRCSSSIVEKAAWAERKVLEELDVGCSLPFGVYARFEGDTFIIVAKLYVEETKSYLFEQRTGPAKDYEKVTAELICAFQKK